MLPLAGVRVLAVEQYGAGPFGTMFLADQGAEVIKIENPNDGGDMARGVGPYFFTQEDSQFFHAYNRNKKSLTLDLGHPDGRAVFHDLVATADAVASNLRGDVPEKLGLTYDALKAHNLKIVCAHLSAYGRTGPRATWPGLFFTTWSRPQMQWLQISAADVPEKLGLTYDALKAHNLKIVCAHLSAYGRTGPRATWPGFDYLMQAEAGYLSLTGEPGSPPTRFGLSVVDQMTGLALTYAVLAGLTGARATGVGRDVDVSLFDIALCNTAYSAIWYLNEGVVQERLARSAHPFLTPCQLYKTRDGWIYIMCNKDKFWPALCKVIGRIEWAKDPRFASFESRFENRAVIEKMLDADLGQRATAEWLDHFAGIIPAAPIYDIGEALENPFVAERDRIQTIALPGYGEYRMIAPPVLCPGEDAPANPAPKLGADTEALLRDLGYDQTRVDELKTIKVI